MLADNKLALNAGWDRDIRAIELQALVDLDFAVELTGFSLAEIDLVLDEASDADPDGIDGAEDEVAFATVTGETFVDLADSRLGIEPVADEAAWWARASYPSQVQVILSRI